MTELLERAVSAIATRSEDEQNRLAAMLLAELETLDGATHTLEQRFDDDYPLTQDDVKAVSAHLAEREGDASD